MTLTGKLPLFPLNVVLFPGMPLPLHIFEERYRLMISRCIAEEAPFGVVLIRKGEEVGGPAEPYMVGTSAAITKVERLSEGRFNIATLGCERFRVTSIEQRRPYLVANVSSYPMDGQGDGCRRRLQELSPLLEHYVARLARLANEDYRLDELPRDPVTLAYLTAIVLQVSLTEKQQMLEVETTEQLLRLQTMFLRREISLIDFMLSNHSVPAAPNVKFSRN